jgi:hypothetical protein
MELLRGETLGEALARRGALPLEEALDIALPLASALAHAHRAGVVHRDIKPDNIFLATDPDGHITPKVLDFGVSKLASVDGRALTAEGVMLGTPSFMSPEQARGSRDVDPRSDVFSAGIVIYMMLCGRNPFASTTFHEVLSAVQHREVPRLDGVPPALWECIAKALGKDPAARFTDGTELATSLRLAAGRGSMVESMASGSHTFAEYVQTPVRLDVRGADVRNFAVAASNAARVLDGSGSEIDFMASVVKSRRRVRFALAGAGFAIFLGGLGLCLLVEQPSDPLRSAVPDAASGAPNVGEAQVGDSAAPVATFGLSDFVDAASPPPARGLPSPGGVKGLGLPKLRDAPPGKASPRKKERSIVRDPGF